MNRIAISLERKTVLLFIVLILTACASGQVLHDEGLTLLDEGKTTEGLAKLQEAVKKEPDNAFFRASLARNREQAINQALTQANNERIAGHLDAAQAAYMRILKFDMNNARANQGLVALEMDKRHNKIVIEAREFIKKGDLDAATDALRPVFLENPDQVEALVLQRKIDELKEKEKSAGPSLTAKYKKPVTLEFRDANLKMVFEALSRTSGINVLLDKDVKQDLKTSIFVKEVSVEDTIDMIRLQNQLEKKILNDNTVFIYPNTPEKNREYQDLKVRSFHLTNADPKVMLSMIKALLKTKDTFINEKTNSLMIRDTPEAIRLAEKMISDQDVLEPEVMLEVEVLEVNRTRATNLGVQWPNSLSLASPTGTTLTTNAGIQSTTTVPGSLDQLMHTGIKDYQVSPLSMAINLLLQDADTNILASPRIRARNREKAKIMIGDRVPVITNAVTPVASGTPVVTGSVQYLDVGLKLEVEPDIHDDNVVAIKINMEVSSIVKEIPNTVSGTLAYQIGTRNASTLLQLKDGETQILAGLIDNEDRATADKVPGLGQLPILGHLFSNNGDNNTKTEIILSITPHIVWKSHIPDARQTEYWSGTEATLSESQLIMKPIGVSSTANAAARQLQLASIIETSETATSTPMVLSWQGPSQAKVGDKISLSLNSQFAQGLNNLGLNVNYDPAVLKVIEVTDGDMLKQSNTKFTQVNGQLQIGLTSNGVNAATAGKLVTLTFEVTGTASQSQITLSKIVPTGSGSQELAYSAPAPLSLTLSK